MNYPKTLFSKWWEHLVVSKCTVLSLWSAHLWSLFLSLHVPVQGCRDIGVCHSNSKCQLTLDMMHQPLREASQQDLIQFRFDKRFNLDRLCERRIRVKCKLQRNPLKSQSSHFYSLYTTEIALDWEMKIEIAFCWWEMSEKNGQTSLSKGYIHFINRNL